MSREKSKTICVNEKCIGCNKCISLCPVLGANISVKDNNEFKVAVSNKCISCGACILSCNHNSRIYFDDTESFFYDLNNGDAISLIVDPAFYYYFGDKSRNVLGYLKKLGVGMIYDASFGTDISMWSHAKYLEENRESGNRKIVANICDAVIRYVQNCSPELLNLFIPVASSADCTAIYASKYLKDNNKFAYISPCVAASTTIKESNYSGIEYGISFDNLYEFIKGKDISDCNAKTSITSECFGKLVAFSDGYKEGLATLVGREKSMFFYNNSMNEISKMLKLYAQMDDDSLPYVLFMTICKHGCVFGNGARKRQTDMPRIYSEYAKARAEVFAEVEKYGSSQECMEALHKRLGNIEASDFYIEFKDNYKQEYIVPEYHINSILNEMHKDTHDKRNINCGACGYNTCRGMAIAVANGYAQIQNCNHFMNDDLQIKSMMDMQFDVLNAHGFNKTIVRLLNENKEKKYVVALGNINKLRSINELYGKEVGDQVLRYVASIFNDFVGDEGCVARYGGSIFGVCFEYAEEYVEMFCNRKYFDCSHLGIGFPVTMRFGIVIVDSTDPERVTRASDMAAFACDKNVDRSRNMYTLFNDDMKRGLDLENQVTNEMIMAMKNEEFVLYLQPQYDALTGELVGAESLCRWLKPDGSMVSPGVFIPIFEKNGYIKDLDKYVWESAFKLVKSWEERGIKFVPISVNVSRVSMVDGHIIRTIKELSEKYPIDKNNIHFEITESAYMNNQSAISDITQKIRDLGYIIAMDDFGSGYSSLNSLKDIPFDILKLDMGFLRSDKDKKNEKKGGDIIGHMIDMAHTLELVTVAEGVETKEQVDMLSNMGCDIIQGYYYSKPVPLGEYEKMLDEFNK